MKNSVILTYFLLCALFLGVTKISIGQTVKKKKTAQTHVAAGPVFSFYKLNPKHTTGKRSGPAFNVYMREYFKFTKSSYIGIGAQYLIHSNSFRSYYFKDSAMNFYDTTFNYDYICKYQDIGVPICFRWMLAENHQKASAFYTELTWIIKRRFSSNMQINNSTYGFSEYDDTAGDTFKTRFLPKKVGTTLGLSAGFDKNFHDKRSGYFIALTYSYGLNTFYFRRSNNLPHDIYQIESFLSLNAGIRF